MDNAPEKTGWEPRLHSAHCAAVTEQEKTSSVTPPVGDLARSGSSRGPRGPPSARPQSRPPRSQLCSRRVPPSPPLEALAPPAAGRLALDSGATSWEPSGTVPLFPSAAGNQFCRAHLGRAAATGVESCPHHRREPTQGHHPATRRLPQGHEQTNLAPFQLRLRGTSTKAGGNRATESPNGEVSMLPSPQAALRRAPPAGSSYPNRMGTPTLNILPYLLLWVF